MAKETPAQKMGRLMSGKWPSLGISVQPQTMPVNSSSGFRARAEAYHHGNDGGDDP